MLVLLLAARRCGASAGAIFPDQIGDFKKGPPKTRLGAGPGAVRRIRPRGHRAGRLYRPRTKHFYGHRLALPRLHRRHGLVRGAPALRAPRPRHVTKLAVSDLRRRHLRLRELRVPAHRRRAPGRSDLQQVYAQLPKLEQSPLPALMTDSAAGRPGSQLGALHPGAGVARPVRAAIPPSVAAFHLGARRPAWEVPDAKGSADPGDLQLSDPEHRPGAATRSSRKSRARWPSGPARWWRSPSSRPIADAAERVLAQVKYETNLTWNEKVPVNRGQAVRAASF